MRAELPPEYCFRCGKEVNYRPPSQRKRSPRAFCCRSCHMKTLNEELNPTRMTPEVREKIRMARLNTGAGVTYAKIYGRHAHRVQAEELLGRKLKPGEVVHHIDGDKRNYAPENIMVFPSQADHVRWHFEHDPRYRRATRGGEANEVPTHAAPADRH